MLIETYYYNFVATYINIDKHICQYIIIYNYNKKGMRKKIITKESLIQKSIMAMAPLFKCRLFRNNVGLFRVDNKRCVRTGLGKGSSDLIGYVERTVTADMVGKKIAVFVAIEVKNEKGKPTVEQTNFIQCIKDAGGIADIARSSEDLQKIIKQ
jgi:hypothetical protein